MKRTFDQFKNWIITLQKENFMKIKLMFSLMSLVLVSTTFGPCQDSALAQTYPTKPINIIVPFPAGTGNDVVARTIGEKLSKSLGQPVVVDNKAGATGAIAAEFVVKAPPDGYTILIPSSSLSLNMSVSTVNYDLVKDFEHVSIVGTVPYVLVVPKSLPVKSVKELVELAKAKPGQLNYASGGIGSVQHLCTEMIKSASQINMVHVPYKGTSAAIADLLEGRVQSLITPLVTGAPYVKDGSLRGLAIGGKNRSPLFPDLPTMAEAGFPTIDMITWFAIVAPARTPKAIVTKLNAEVTKIMEMDDVKERLSKLGVVSYSSTPEEATAFIKKDVATWAKAIKDSGVKMQ
jgi:tripartite-type tricarboxylate transporter receptor subunit TctC